MTDWERLSGLDDKYAPLHRCFSPVLCRWHWIRAGASTCRVSAGARDRVMSVAFLTMPRIPHHQATSSFGKNWQRLLNAGRTTPDQSVQVLARRSQSRNL